MYKFYTIQFISILLVLSCFSVNSQSKKAAKLLENYLSVAQRQVSYGKTPLVKWDKDTIRYRIIGYSPYMSENQWRAFLSELTGLTGIIFEKTDESSFHILVYFGSLREYAELLHLELEPYIISTFDFFSNRSLDDSGCLKNSSYCLVPNKNADYQTGMYFVKKYFLQALGLLGETDDEFSIFFRTYSGRNHSLNRSDKRLIKLHYLDYIECGMQQQALSELLEKSGDLETLSKEKL